MDKKRGTESGDGEVDEGHGTKRDHTATHTHTYTHTQRYTNARTTNRSLASLCLDLSGCHSRDKARYRLVIVLVDGFSTP